MKAPICFLCNKDFGSEYFHFRTGGSMVQFADFEPLLKGRAGHPQGLEWFCNEHVQAAQALAAHTTGEALSKLRGRYGVFPPYESKPYRDPELWVTDVGPNAPQVFAILRRASQASPAEAQELLASGVFKVAQGWQSALVEAAAEVEIRFP